MFCQRAPYQRPHHNPQLRHPNHGPNIHRTFLPPHARPNNHNGPIHKATHAQSRYRPSHNEDCRRRCNTAYQASYFKQEEESKEHGFGGEVRVQLSGEGLQGCRGEGVGPNVPANVGKGVELCGYMWDGLGLSVMMNLRGR
jgi:hypothetical protein